MSEKQKSVSLRALADCLSIHEQRNFQTAPSKDDDEALAYHLKICDLPGHHDEKRSNCIQQLLSSLSYSIAKWFRQKTIDTLFGSKLCCYVQIGFWYCQLTCISIWIHLKASCIPFVPLMWLTELLRGILRGKGKYKSRQQKEMRRWLK